MEMAVYVSAYGDSNRQSTHGGFGFDSLNSRSSSEGSLIEEANDSKKLI